MDQPRPAKSKRRWFQFRLRTLLVFVTLFAFASGWLAVKMKQARRQAIREACRRVWYDYEWHARRTGSTPQPPGPPWMWKLLGDDFFAKVVGASEWNDASLELLKELWDRSVNDLHLRSTGTSHLTRASPSPFPSPKKKKSLSFTSLCPSSVPRRL